MKCSGLFDDTISIIIGGEAGQGISRSGLLLGKALMRAGFQCFGEIDCPSLWIMGLTEVSDEGYVDMLDTLFWAQRRPVTIEEF
jgi:hypothetical protein